MIRFSRVRIHHGFFCQKFNFSSFKIENEETKFQEELKSRYTPKFILRFNKKGLLKIYQSQANSYRLLVYGVLGLSGYTLYNILFKWYNNSKLKNLFCLFAFIGTLVALKHLIPASMNICTSLFLSKNGEDISFTTILHPVKRSIKINTISNDNELLSKIIQMKNSHLIFSKSINLFLLGDPQFEPWYLDIDLLEAITKGIKINTTSSINENIIDL